MFFIDTHTHSGNKIIYWKSIIRSILCITINVYNLESMMVREYSEKMIKKGRIQYIRKQMVRSNAQNQCLMLKVNYAQSQFHLFQKFQLSPKSKLLFINFHQITMQNPWVNKYQIIYIAYSILWCCDFITSN